MRKLTTAGLALSAVFTALARPALGLSDLQYLMLGIPQVKKPRDRRRAHADIAGRGAPVRLSTFPMCLSIWAPRSNVGSGRPLVLWEAAPTAQRERWNPIPSVVCGVTFGALAGGLMIWGFEGGDRWQDQAGVLLEMTTAITLAAVAVSYVRRLY
jgi:hypothetical protein